MNTYKRPHIRTHDSNMNTSYSRPESGTFLHKITNPAQTKRYEMEPYYIQDYDNYIKNLKKSYEMTGAQFKMPKYAAQLPPAQRGPPVKAPVVEYVDNVLVRLTVLKCGKIRVKLISNMATLHEKYFSKAKKPPVKVLVAALKAYGYDETFLSKLPNNITKRREHMELRWKKLDAVLNKPSTSNSKKKAKKKEPEPEPEIEDECIDDDDDVDDDAAPDEEAIDVDNEDEDEEIVEEEYFSDGD